MARNKDVDWSVCKGLPTRIYRNLLNGKMSLQQQINKSWLVIGHVTDVVISYPKFYVSEPGRQRVIAEKQKNVHAYSSGLLSNVSLAKLPELAEIHYCPYSQSYFSWKESGLPIEHTDLLVVIENKVYCSVVSHPPQLSLF
jgi:hypothetical protein